MSRFEQETGDVARLIGFMTKPVVAAVEGFAMGGGFILATSCDLVVASRGSRWNLPEVPIGWLTPWGIKSLVARWDLYVRATFALVSKRCQATRRWLLASLTISHPMAWHLKMLSRGGSSRGAPASCGFGDEAVLLSFYHGRCGDDGFRGQPPVR